MAVIRIKIPVIIPAKRLKYSIQAKVIWGEDGSPADDVGVRLYAWNRPNPRINTDVGWTNKEGEVLFEGVDAGKVLLESDRGASSGSVRTEVEPGTITCVAIGPAPDTLLDPLTGELQLL